MSTPSTTEGSDAARPVRLGLRENWLQFTLLVVVNVCVGALVGLERTTVPLIGTDVFGLTSDLAVFSFIIAFGLTKALTNLAAGALTGPARRGLATGLNEAAGYVAVGATALLTGYLATIYGLRPTPELIGVVFVAAGLALSVVVRDTATTPYSPASSPTPST